MQKYSRTQINIRRLSALSYFLAGVVCGGSISTLLALLVGFSSGATMPNQKFKMILLLALGASVISVSMMVLFRWGLRNMPALNGLNRVEMGVILKWTCRGDPLGHRLGGRKCHQCDHERRDMATCPECGVERIDPVPHP